MKKNRPVRFRRLSNIFSPKASIDFEREWRKLTRLQEINQLLNSELDPKKLLDLIMDIVVDLTRAERGFLILNRDDSDEIVVARNIDQEAVQRAEFKISHSIAERVRETGQPILTDDAMSEANLSAFSSVSDLQLRSVLCIPFRVKERIIGTLYLDHRFERGKFSDEDLRLLEVFSNQAAIALENSRLLQEARSAREALERLNSELEGRLRLTEQELESFRNESQSSLEPLRHDYGKLVGKSPPMRRLLHLLDRVTDTNLSVVLLGESGTGKELIARILHDNGPRRDGPFVSLNCGAIPASLLETELFGHVRGAFTGAIRDKLGLFEVAHGGTLFLDEVAEMEPPTQAKFLRTLENGEIRPVGAAESRRVDVRVISATNKDLEGAVDTGRFRADLYYRLKGFVLRIPPLRDRPTDVPLLVDSFLDQISVETRAARKSVSSGAMCLLQRYHWPGNVRELQNEIRRLEALSGDEIDEALLQREFVPLAPTRIISKSGGSRTLAQVEKAAIVAALQASGWKKMEAARSLGIARRTLYDKMNRYRIPRSMPPSGYPGTR